MQSKLRAYIKVEKIMFLGYMYVSYLIFILSPTCVSTRDYFLHASLYVYPSCKVKCPSFMPTSIVGVVSLYLFCI